MIREDFFSQKLMAYTQLIAKKHRLLSLFLGVILSLIELTSGAIVSH